MMSRKKENNTPTKILMIIDNLDQGGAQTLLVDLVTGINRSHFEPLVCSLRNSQSCFFDSFEAAGVKVFQLGYGRLSPLKLFQLLRLIKKERVEIVHTHLTASRIIGVLAGKLSGVKKIVSHDHSGDEFLHKNPFLALYVLYPLDRFLMRFTDYLFCVSKATALFNVDLKRIPPEKVEIVHNWIDAERFLFSKRCRDELRKSWFIPEDSIVVGSVGRLSEQKGFRYLIEAAPVILKKCPNAIFVIVGDGDERQTLEDLAVELNVRDRIYFQAFMPDIEKAYSAFDFFVLPSIYEPFGLVVLEAMAAGVPVIAADVGGVPEIIQNKVNGVLVSPESPLALAKTIIAVVNDSRWCKSMVTAGKACVLESFDRKKAILRLENFYSYRTCSIG